MTEAKHYANEKLNAPIALRIYPGRDGEFAFYTDRRDDYGYENGDYFLTRVRWTDDTRKVLYKVVHCSEGVNDTILSFCEHIIEPTA